MLFLTIYNHILLFLLNYSDSGIILSLFRVIEIDTHNTIDMTKSYIHVENKYFMLINEEIFSFSRKEFVMLFSSLL